VTPVAVTGLGVVSPFGAGVKAFWEGISGGLCAIRPITLIDTEGFRCRIAAEVPDPLGGSARRSRADRFALAAAREALDDAGGRVVLPLGARRRGRQGARPRRTARDGRDRL
jgi:3-oxoacyl-(acyl-carrier-protein) synthase